MPVNTTDDTVNKSNADAANDDASEPHGNPNEKLNENRPMHTTKGQRGDMTPEEYTNQPESNTNAPALRDIDDPDYQEVSDEERETERLRAENAKQLERDVKKEKERSAEEAHADEVAERQRSKLNSNSKEGVDSE